MAPGLVEPALGLDAIGVGEHPYTIQIAVEVLGELRWWLGQFAAEAELLDGPRTAVGTDDRQHQRVPVEPWSAIAWSAANRDSANGAMRSGVLARCDQLRHLLAACRDPLESPGSPAGGDDESVDSREPHDRREVGGDVATPGPLPEDLEVADEREQERHLQRAGLQELERRLARVARLAFELVADQHLPARCLRHVAEQVRRRHDRAEPLCVAVGDERLQRMGTDRQPQAGVSGDGRHVTANGAHDHARGDVAARSFHANDSLAIAQQPGYRRALQHVHAALHRALRIRPHDTVVAS